MDDIYYRYVYDQFASIGFKRDSPSFIPDFRDMFRDSEAMLRSGNSVPPGNVLLNLSFITLYRGSRSRDARIL